MLPGNQGTIPQAGEPCQAERTMRDPATFIYTGIAGKRKSVEESGLAKSDSSRHEQRHDRKQAEHHDEHCSGNGISTRDVLADR